MLMICRPTRRKLKGGWRNWPVGMTPTPFLQWLKSLPGCRESSDFELWHKWLLPEMPADQIEKICHELTFQYRQVKGFRCVVEGGREVIKILHARGYKLGIISNLIGETEIQDWLKDDRLEDYFDALVLSPVCGIRKPDPRAYLMGCEQLGFKPEECASVADNLNRDIVGAKAAGLGMTIGVRYPGKKPQEVTEENKPDLFIDHFAKLLDIFPPLK